MINLGCTFECSCLDYISSFSPYADCIGLWEFKCDVWTVTINVTLSLASPPVPKPGLKLPGTVSTVNFGRVHHSGTVFEPDTKNLKYESQPGLIPSDPWSLKEFQCELYHRNPWKIVTFGAWKCPASMQNQNWTSFKLVFWFVSELDTYSCCYRS